MQGSIVTQHLRGLPYRTLVFAHPKADRLKIRISITITFPYNHPKKRAESLKNVGIG